MTIVQKGVLVCMVMDKLLDRAPAALTGPAQPLHGDLGPRSPV